MSRLDIKTPSRAQTVVEGLYRDVERRIAASPPGLCPVDMSLSFLQLCHAQTCGKCVPCRIGLGQLTLLINQVLDGEATMETIAIIEKTARSIVNTADCAIGRDAARLVVEGLEGFRDDYEEHVKHNRCLAGLQNPVPCVALCPAGVDIPGYMALVGEDRCADAVRLIRKDNPFPTACAYICEHPCEARCRRNMVDDAINIRGLKRYVVDHAGVVPQPECAPATGKKVVVIGGGNVAMDVTRSSIRLGADKVTCVYRRRQADMTALPDEITGALAEGAELMTLAAPVRIEADEDGAAKALWVQPQIIGEVDKAGRPRPGKAALEEVRIPADVIVVAIGQGVEIQGFDQAGVPIQRGAFVAGLSGQVRDMDSVFAGGDCVTGPATAIRAIAAGKVAAANIDEHLGFRHEITVDVEIPSPKLNNSPPHGRIDTTEREACERKHDFEDIECGLTQEGACAEAGRCLRCDHFGYGIFRGGRNEKW